MCRALTRFTAHEVWQLLEHFDMLRPDGEPKMYRIYTSLKSYRKRGERTKHKKYFLCSADTAMMVLLCHMARPGGYVDLQATFNGMPAPEMGRIVNFLLLYLIPCDHRGTISGAQFNGLPIDSTCTLRPLRTRAAL